MNTDLFLEWIHELDAHVGRKPNRRVVLLMDNANCHLRPENLTELQNLEVAHLPARTTTRMQQLEAGIIASFKRKYRRRKIE